MKPERSNPLHNFNLPSRLRWGTQRHLRCKKLDFNDDPHQSQPQPPPPRSNRPPRSEDGSQIEAIGQRLMLDFKLRMDNLKVVVGGGGADEENEKDKDKTAVAGDGLESSRPWNLRTRRSPAPGPEVGVVEKWRKERSSPVKRVRGGGSVSEEKVKVRVPLKREEIEEDFLMMAGIKPPRRPRKRPRAIQKELDTLFPGLWLTAVTPEIYDVPDAPES